MYNYTKNGAGEATGNSTTPHANELTTHMLGPTEFTNTVGPSGFIHPNGPSAFTVRK